MTSRPQLDYGLDAALSDGTSAWEGIKLQSGGVTTEYASISAALAAASSGDVVLVSEGTWIEDFTYPAGVTVKGTGASRSTIIVGKIMIADGCTLSSVTLVGPSSGTDPAVDGSALTGVGGGTSLFQVIFVGGGSATAPMVKGAASGSLTFTDCIYAQGTAKSYIDCTDGGTFIISGGFVASGTLTSVIDMSSGGAALEFISPFKIRNATVATNGLLLGANCSVRGYLFINDDSSIVNGIHITGSPVDLRMNASQFPGSSFDLLVDGAVDGTGSTIVFSACNFTQERSSVPAIWADNLTVGLFQYNDLGVNNDPISRVGGGFAIGAAVRPAPFFAGGGGDVTQGMTVLSDSGGGSFVDNSDAAKSRDGSTFSVWQGTISGGIFYIGSAGFTFPAFYTDVTTAMVGSASDVVWEFWNGSVWTAVDVMEHTDDGFDARANRVFQTVGQHYVHVDIDAMGSWDTTTVNSITAYYVRARLAGAITTVPILERTQIATNRLQGSTGGFLTFFGTGQPERELIVHRKLNDDLSGASPSTATFALSSGVTVNFTDMRYNNGADDGNVFEVRLPAGLNTARKLNVVIEFVPKGSGTGQVKLKILFIGPIEVGTDMDSGTIPQVAITTADVERPGTNQTDAIPEIESGTADQLYRATYKVDISEKTSGSTLAMAIVREDSSDPDSFSDAIEIYSVTANGRAWRST